MVFFLLVVFGLLSFTSSQISHQYHFINIRKNWTEAQRFCREQYIDLATVNNSEEMYSLFSTISDVSCDVYIGLYRSEVFGWHWSLPDSLYSEESYQNWKDKQPNINKEGCAVMDTNGKWFNDSCDSLRSFVCFNAKANKKYILIGLNKSWREAHEYCRTFHTDLANVRNSSENNDVRTVARTSWIGLFKDPWSWSDQSKSSFRFWTTSQFSNIRSDQDCVSVMASQTGEWNGVKCNATQPFICHVDLKSQSTTKPATLGVATTTEHTPAQNTTEGENTSSQPTQILTTGPEQGPLPPSTAKQNPNTSHESIPGATATQPGPAKNTTEGGNTSSQQVQILTTVSDQDNLILVHQNLTWAEAATYCRKHHVDLVSIHSDEIQNRVARRAIHASTSHVWLGLRYTCSFNFWFWTNTREAGCYQNWASGHGPHGYKECGLSGAMESTGGHHWVGRPESERLNFICQLCADTL